jgi:hypothetical protein
MSPPGFDFSFGLFGKKSAAEPEAEPEYDYPDMIPNPFANPLPVINGGPRKLKRKAPKEPDPGEAVRKAIRITPGPAPQQPAVLTPRTVTLVIGDGRREEPPPVPAVPPAVVAPLNFEQVIAVLEETLERTNAVAATADRLRGRLCGAGTVPAATREGEMPDGLIPRLAHLAETICRQNARTRDTLVEVADRI